MNIREPKYNARGTIDCEVEHQTYGWIPFTADPDDLEEIGREIYKEVMEGKHGSIAEYVPPQPPTHEELVARVEAARKAAYADAQTGSDRHFAEAARLEAIGDTAGAEDARAAGLVRYDEIRAEHPWPAEEA